MHAQKHACVPLCGSVPMKTCVLVSVNCHNEQESTSHMVEKAEQILGSAV